MVRRLLSLAPTMGLLMILGCGENTAPAPAPTSGQANYGPDKKPTPEQAAPKRGRAAGYPGAPPAR